MNSPSTNVAVMYSSENKDTKAGIKHSTASTQPSIASLISDPPIKFESNPPLRSPSISAPFNHASMPPPPNQNYNLPTPDPVMVSDADLLLNLHSPFSGSSPANTRNAHPNTTSYTRTSSTPNNSNNQQQPSPLQNDFSPQFGTYATPSDNTFGDMVIDTQDIDMSLLGPDMMPWDIEYLPHDMLYFGEGAYGNNGLGDNGTSGMREGQQ